MEPVVQEQNDQGQWVDIPADPIEAPEVPAAADASAEVPEEKPAAAAKPAPAEKKPRHDAQARIDELTRLRREAERRAEEAERRASERERELADLRKPAAKEPAKEPAKAERFPTYEAFLKTNPDASLEDYMDARDDWRDQRAAAATKQTAEAERLDQSFQTRVGGFRQKFADAIKTDESVRERIDPALFGVKPYSSLTAADHAIIKNISDERERNLVAFRCFLADQWIDSEHPIALLEHLSDPDNFQRLAALPPNQVIRELAKLESGFSAASAPARGPAEKPKAVSQAPAPIKPLKSTPHQSEDAEPGDDASDDEWARWEIARQKRSRARA